MQTWINQAKQRTSQHISLLIRAWFPWQHNLKLVDIIFMHIHSFQGNTLCTLRQPPSKEDSHIWFPGLQHLEDLCTPGFHRNTYWYIWFPNQNNIVQTVQFVLIAEINSTFDFQQLHTFCAFISMTTHLVMLSSAYMVRSNSNADILNISMQDNCIIACKTDQ